MKTASELQDTAKSKPESPRPNAPNATPKKGAWQFYFIAVALGLGLLVLLGKALGLF